MELDARFREGARRQEGQPQECSIDHCRLEGCSGASVPAETDYRLITTPEGLVVNQIDTGTSIFYPFEEIISLKIGGPRHQKPGGGSKVRGFDAAGIAEGELLTRLRTIMEARTTLGRTTNEAVIHIQTATSEFIFSHEGQTPEQLKLLLAPAFTRLRALYQTK
jgi:hypothetical protein